MKRINEHPEVSEVKNICDISPKAKTTKKVCDKIKKERKNTTSHIKK